ncbi:MAG: hypothetical protein SO044_00910 [Agathobaculum sp.]|uniref:hypothetical protein n=1 Tax=Agathobaculum sp. TaxID=2048138 RepID=UPI002A7F7F9D|nr:hypothetical protein [Agathobaculum sp.]MDY3710963.1 hypothetical protein [Agathobaculum sp.]
MLNSLRQEVVSMPAFATHHIFATTVQRVTCDAAAHLIELYPAGYRWGAQGPDPLAFYHAPFSGAMGRLARRMHNEPPGALFEALCDTALTQHDTAALVYVFGFCTHYALDRVSYSFIEAQADRLALFMTGYSAAARRQLVKSDLDGILISHYISPDAAQFEAFRLLDPTAAECTVLSRVLASAVRRVYGVRLSPAAVYRSLHDMRRVLRLAHSGVSVRARLQRFEHLTGKAGLASSLIRPPAPLPADCANQAHRPWPSPSGERSESFCDLFDAAVPLAVSLQRAVLDRYYQQKPLDSRFFPTDFTGHRPEN